MPVATWPHAQLIEGGLTDRELRRFVGTGALIRLRRGTFAGSDAWSEADDVARHASRARDIGQVLAGSAAISHGSAAVLHGLPVPIHVLVRVHATWPGSPAVAAQRTSFPIAGGSTTPTSSRSTGAS